MSKPFILRFVYAGSYVKTETPSSLSAMTNSSPFHWRERMGDLMRVYLTQVSAYSKLVFTTLKLNMYYPAATNNSPWHRCAKHAITLGKSEVGATVWKSHTAFFLFLKNLMSLSLPLWSGVWMERAISCSGGECGSGMRQSG